MQSAAPRKPYRGGDVAMSEKRDEFASWDRVADKLGGYAIGVGVVLATLMVGVSFLRW